jgi:signal transduction histidine kinase
MLRDRLAAWRKDLAPGQFTPEQMAELYRPLVRGFCAIVCFFYLIIGTLILPFLESAEIAVVLVPMRITLGVAAAAAYYVTRRMQSLWRLEAVMAGVSLFMVATFLTNQLTEFRAAALFNFVLLLVVTAAASPTVRVLLVNMAATVAAWLYVAERFVPDLLALHASMAIAGCVVAALVWGLLHHALNAVGRALRIAEQRGDELERFAYVCSHDMQEPARMMNIYAGLLQEDAAGRLDEDGLRHVGLIRENAVRMQTMIRDILAFSRIDSQPVEIQPVDANRVAAAVLSGLEPEVVGKGAVVTCGELPVVMANPTLLTLILQNLIGNALKFQDGSRPPEIALMARAEPGLWRFEVRDNGIGIDPAYRDEVFTLFRRLNRKEEYPGTGIGLSACRKFLRLYGGEIDFEPAPGGGSTFWFTLPRQDKRHEA